MMIFIWCWFI